MRELSNEHEKVMLMEETVDHVDDQVWTGRRKLIAYLGLLATTGCSSNSGSSYRYSAGYSTGYRYGGSRYYGRNTYRRSPARRGRVGRR